MIVSLLRAKYWCLNGTKELCYEAICYTHMGCQMYKHLKYLE